MPREIVVLSPTAPDLRALVEAGAAVDPDLGMRTLDGGAVHQIVREHADGTTTAVLSVHQPLAVERTEDVARLLPTGPTLVEHLSLPLWWVEMLAPWGRAGEPGVAIAQELAARLGAACVVHDGT